MQRNFGNLAAGMRPARVIAVHRGAYLVDDGAGEHRAHISGRLRFQSIDESNLPAAGDWIAVTGAPNARSTLVVDWIAPRTSVLLRNAPGRAARAQVLAANIDVVLLAAALPDDVNLRRLERVSALVWESGAVPVVVLTKADLCNDVEGALACGPCPPNGHRRARSLDIHRRWAQCLHALSSPGADRGAARTVGHGEVDPTQRAHERYRHAYCDRAIRWQRAPHDDTSTAFSAAQRCSAHRHARAARAAKRKAAIGARALRARLRSKHR